MGGERAWSGGLTRASNRNRLQLYKVPQDELAHYSKATFDVMYHFPHGVEELEGIANRTDFDLGSHTRSQADFNLTAKVMPNTDSNSKLAIQDLDTKAWVVPYVIEPSAGVDRGVLAVLNEAYSVQKLDNGTERTVLALQPAPRADQGGGAAAEAQPRRHHDDGARHQADAAGTRRGPRAVRRHRQHRQGLSTPRRESARRCA